MTENNPEIPQVKPADFGGWTDCWSKLAYSDGFRAGSLAERAHLPQWQPIETAPKDGTWVLTFGDGVGFASCHTIGYFGITTGSYQPDIPQWRQAGFLGAPITPTHWMPLPEPPATLLSPEAETRAAE